MSSSALYPEDFVSTVKQRFPLNEGLHDDLDWGRHWAVSRHFDQLLFEQDQALETLRHKLSKNGVFSFTPKMIALNRRQYRYCRKQRNMTAALQKLHDNIKPGIAARTAHFPLRDQRQSNIIKPTRKLSERVTVRQRSAYEH